MMKKQILSILVILFIFNNVICQEDIKSKYPIDEETQLITFQEVVQEEGTKNELFNRCINWLNNFYNNPVSVTKVRDNKTGKIKGNHRFRLNYFDKDGNKLDGAMVLYSFVIELKDGRYRYTITDFVLKKTSRYPAEKWLDKSDPAYNPQWNKYLKQLADFVAEWSENLKMKMKPAPEKVEEEW